MSWERWEDGEPAILAGALTAAAAVLALIAAGLSVPHALAVGFGGSGAQALLTRPAVFSPRSLREIRAGEGIEQRLPEIMTVGRGLPHGADPTTTIGAAVAAGSLVLQLFTGSDFALALTSAGGIAGVQAVATRARTSSPGHAQRATLEALLLKLDEDNSEKALSKSSIESGQRSLDPYSILYGRAS